MWNGSKMSTISERHQWTRRVFAFRSRGMAEEVDASQDDISVRCPNSASANVLGWSMPTSVRKFVKPGPCNLHFLWQQQIQSVSSSLGEKKVSQTRLPTAALLDVDMIAYLRIWIMLFDRSSGPWFAGQIAKHLFLIFDFPTSIATPVLSGLYSTYLIAKTYSDDWESVSGILNYSKVFFARLNE